MASEKQVGVRGKVLNSQSREVIANVLRFMKQEAANGSPIIPVNNYKQRLIQATGISDRIYRQINRDMQLIDAGKLGGFTAPNRATRPIEIIEVKCEALIDQNNDNEQENLESNSVKNEKQYFHCS